MSAAGNYLAITIRGNDIIVLDESDEHNDTFEQFYAERVETLRRLWSDERIECISRSVLKLDYGHAVTEWDRRKETACESRGDN